MDTTAHFKFVPYADTTSLSAAVSNDSINLGIWFSSSFDQNYQAKEQGEYGVFYRSADMEEYDRFQ